MPTAQAVAVAVASALAAPGAALGLGRRRLGRRWTGGLHPAELLGDDEVSEAVGTIVMARGRGLCPRRRSYGPPGSRRRLVTVSVAYGAAGSLLMRARRPRGRWLPGLGDEAYTGETWAIARRGRITVLVSQPRHVCWGVPGGLVWLLGLALRRMRDAS